MSHLNAVTVLLAAFATRGSKIKAEANQAIRTYRNDSAPFRKKRSRRLRRSRAWADFRPMMQGGNGSLADHKSANQAQIRL